MTEQERNDLVGFRIKKAKDTLRDTAILIENQLWSVAINRLYYACYYAVIALLLKNNIAAQTHGGVRQMFGLHFIKTGVIDNDLGKFYTDIFDKRQTGDYSDFVEIQKDDVMGFFEPTKRFISEIEKLLKV
jgi:uncharacterized protein (UPF0332 family)